MEQEPPVEKDSVVESKEGREHEALTHSESTENMQNLPGYLPWEEDLEMVSKYLDRKVAWVSGIECKLGFNSHYLPSV